jgi:hypothetical protein
MLNTSSNVYIIAPSFDSNEFERNQGQKKKTDGLGMLSKLHKLTNCLRYIIFIVQRRGTFDLLTPK